MKEKKKPRGNLVKALQVRQSNREATKKKFLVAFNDNLGFVSRTCRELDMSPRTYEKWVIQDKEFKEKIDEILTYHKEELEYNFINMLRNNQKIENLPGNIFYLKAKAGWRENIVEQEDTNINLTVSYSE